MDQLHQKPGISQVVLLLLLSALELICRSSLEDLMKFTVRA